MYGASAIPMTMAPAKPIMVGPPVPRFGGWLPPIKLPTLQMVGPEPLKLSKEPFMSERKRINVVPIVLSLFVPWFIYLAVCGCASFYWRYSSPGIAWFIITFCAAIVLGFGMMSLHYYRKRAVFNEAGREPTWYGFLFATSLLYWILGFAIGSSNYSANMMPYYQYQALETYPNVWPGQTSGKMVLDSGILIFKPEAFPDTSKAVAFKNTDTYCIAPVVSDANPLVSYDFWAVGKNCCPGTIVNGQNQVKFTCGDADASGSLGMGGLRVVNDDASLGYYKLALQQAIERFKIAAATPIFLEWARDPLGKVSAYEDRGLKRYLFWLLFVFAIQLFLVITGVVIISKTLQ